MKLMDIKEPQAENYDIVVASKLGRFVDHKNLTSSEAKRILNDTVGDYQSDIFPEDPLATVEWKTGGTSAVITQHTGNKIFFYIVRSNR